jgi:hypothetical protein
VANPYNNPTFLILYSGNPGTESQIKVAQPSEF